MKTGTFAKLDGEIEVEETSIGGKARNMHKSKRAKKITGTGGKDKAIVAGVLQRGGEIRSVQPWHLFRYIDERVFTYNERYLTDLDRFLVVLGTAAGRRLTYKALTGLSDQEAPRRPPESEGSDRARFAHFAKKLVQVPKKEIDEKAEEWKRERDRKR
jgi:ISXO2-like transposase domain